MALSLSRLVLPLAGALFCCDAAVPLSPAKPPAALSHQPLVSPPGIAYLDPPFTEDELRRSTKPGQAYEFLVEVPPQPPHRRRMLVVATSDVGITLETTLFDRDGNQDKPAERSTSSWAEWTQGARFAAEQTQVTHVREDTPAGSYDCLRYTVIRGPEKTVQSFAKTLPGPPILVTTETNGALISMVSLLKYSE